MNILIISDIHNDIENMMVYIDKISLLDFDVIVMPGDFTDYNLPKGFTEKDIGNIIFEEMSSLKKPVLALPGNLDKEILSLLEEKKISLHGRGRIIQDVGFYGFGGARTPFGTPLEPTEDEIKVNLEKAYDEVGTCKKKIQVTHMPPARTKIDKIASGAHVGSEIIRSFIEEKQPVAAISAHIHEARGVDELGATKLINSGRFPEGYCGLVTVKEEKVTTKVINLI